MTKKHFIELADDIRRHNKWADSPFTLQQIGMLADFCQSVDPRFNRKHWLAYIAGECGPDGGSVKNAGACVRNNTAV